MLWRCDVDPVIWEFGGLFHGESLRFFVYLHPVLCNAQMAKLVDALLSGGSAARCAGSSPVLGTNFVRGGDNCPVGEIGRHAILRGW